MKGHRDTLPPGFESLLPELLLHLLRFLPDREACRLGCTCRPLRAAADEALVRRLRAVTIEKNFIERCKDELVRDTAELKREVDVFADEEGTLVVPITLDELTELKGRAAEMDSRVTALEDRIAVLKVDIGRLARMKQSEAWWSDRL